MVKKQWRILVVFLVLVCSFFVLSAAAEEENLPPVRFPEETYTLKTGERLRINVITEKAYRSRKNTYEWVSDNEEVAPVDSYGTVTGTAPGKATIRYIVTTPEGITAVAVCRVIVIRPVKGLHSEEKEVHIIPGDMKELSVQILPEDASNQVLEWTSQNEEIAIVNESGTVCALQSGKTKITARTTDGSNQSVTWDIVIPSVYTEQNEYEILEPGSIQIPVFFEGEDFEENYLIEATGAEIEHEYEIVANKALFTVKPVAAGDASLKVINRKNSTDRAETAIHIDTGALTNPERLRITNVELVNGTRNLVYKFDMVNRSTIEIGEIGFVVDYRDQFGDTHYMVSNSDGTIQNHQYTTMLNIKPGTTGTVVGQNDVFRANDLITEVRVAICYYRFLTGEKVYIPDCQLYWYSTKTGEMELPEVKGIYAQPDEDTMDRSLRLSLGATTCNLYSYVVKPFCRSKRPGIYVAALSPNGYAAQWGLQVGDVIYGEDDVLWYEDPFMINRALCGVYDGNTVTLKVVRNGEEIEIPTTKNTGETPTTPPAEE